MKTGIIKIVTYLLIFLSALNIFQPVFSNSKLFTERFNPKIYEKKYNLSQYVIPQSKNPISDEELLSYAGYKYATGLNPILINSDHPPMGKYIIGWITLLTGNNRIVSIVFALGNMFLVFYLIYLLTKSNLLAGLGIFFLSLDSMFIDQIIHSPILDIIQVFFLLLYFLFFLFWLKKEQYWKVLLMGLALGAMSATKLYFPAIVVLGATGLTLLILRIPIKKIFYLIVSVTLLTFITYTFSYIVFFFNGGTIRSFLGAQKWIFLFWKNNSVQSSEFIGDALTLILFNQWKVWWGNKTYIQFEHWNILWPIFFTTGFLSSIYLLTKYVRVLKKNILQQSAILISVWIICVTIYLSFLPISPRYILILFFPIYVIIPLMIKLIGEQKLNNKLKKE